MRAFSVVLLILVVAGGLIGLNSFYTVRQDYQAIVLQFGNPVVVRNQFKVNEAGLEEDEAGLFFKLPWEDVVYLDRKNIGTTIANIEVFASDRQRLTVDAFVRWRITDPLQFYQRLRTEDRAAQQIVSFTDAGIRNALAKVPVPEIVSGQRAQLMEDIREAVNESLQGTGIAVIDVRIRKADLPESIAARVYEQMKTEREQEAQRIRSEGEEEARRIRARSDRDVTVILAKAREESETVRGEGDARANEIYAEAYTKDEEFFRFQRALIACEQSIQTGTKIVVAPDNLDLCKVFIDQARVASSNR